MAVETLSLTIWLGVKLSALAAGLAVVLSLLGDVSRWPLVAAVALTAFAASWVQAGRLERGDGPLLLLTRTTARHSR